MMSIAVLLYLLYQAETAKRGVPMAGKIVLGLFIGVTYTTAAAAAYPIKWLYPVVAGTTSCIYVQAP